MKKVHAAFWVLFAVLFGTAGTMCAQGNYKRLVTSNTEKKDSVNHLIDLAGIYRFSKPDSSIFLAKKALDLARRINDKKGEGTALYTLGEDLHLRGDYPQALETLFSALRIGTDIADTAIRAFSLEFIGNTYVSLGEYREGLAYLLRSKKMIESFSGATNNPLFKVMRSLGFATIGSAYEEMSLLDSALVYQQKALQLRDEVLTQLPPPVRAGADPLKFFILRNLGIIEHKRGNNGKALDYWHAVSSGEGDVLNPGAAQLHIAQFYQTENNIDSGLYYAMRAYRNSQRSFQKALALGSCTLLAQLYKMKNNLDSAYHYQSLAMNVKDSLFGVDKMHQLQLLAIREQQRQQELEQEKERFENSIKFLALLGVLLFLLSGAILLYRNNRHKQRANELLQQQKYKTEKAYAELKATQQQLVQQEKMASLGELTAGIAHEIQNPLNFVNNFSGVNKELVEELELEAQRGNVQEVIALAADIKTNEEKIAHHGRRADSIVKGMLQHARRSTGEKQPADINKLVDEYLRLSYQGMRAKDKNFNAAIDTHMDESIENIQLVPQDIGRVLLNLFNNAFYAVSEKKRQLNGTFEPWVEVSTKKQNNTVVITVKDNGTGMPAKVAEKVFQPFFTTKPTGEGTGLGLSLSYDIITKGHGGTLSVHSTEGEGSEFVVTLPSL